MQITRREFSLGPHRISGVAGDPGAAPYVIGGRRMYALGFGSGEIGPIGAEHLVGEMGGIWAHPCKVAGGVLARLLDHAGERLPAHEATFSEHLGEVRWRWRAGPIQVTRSDRVLPERPGYALVLRCRNAGAAPVAGAIELEIPVAFLGAWFGGIACDGGRYRQVGALVVGQDGIQTGWGVALGAEAPADTCAIVPQARGATVVFRYTLRLAPGEELARHVLLAVSHQGGAAAATEAWRAWHGDVPALFAAEDDGRRAADDRVAAMGRPLLSGAAELERDLALAQANLQLLHASYPDVGDYFLAGLPEYPQLFGCDTTYSVPGAVAGGFAPVMRSALATLAGYAARACGRVPHEITTNGRVFHPGNIQETPQLTIACWDYLRWTGDTAFAAELFPLLSEGMNDLLPAHGGGSFYPLGDGMVERLGMGSRKLDSACYAIAGLLALARIAEVLGRPDADGYRERARAIRAAFERDWWIEAEGLYADSMHSDGSLQLDGHWTAVLPVQLGLARPERAERVLRRIEAEFVNEWGLVHTRQREELVWTLPTGLLALAAFAHGRAELGLRLAQRIALTAQHGTLGTFKELIPEGLCFIQLWSAALYIQVIVEGLLGIGPDAPAHAVTIAPCLPAGLGPISLEQLRIGEHRLSLTLDSRSLRLTHHAGPQALTVIYGERLMAVGVGETWEAGLGKLA